VHSPAAATNAGTRIGRNERFPQQYPAEDPSTDRIAARIGTGFEFPAAVLRDGIHREGSAGAGSTFDPTPIRL
jgi:hypothetical protein